MIRRSLVALFAVAFICFALAIGVTHAAGVAQGDMGSGIIVEPNELAISVADGCSRAIGISPPPGCYQEHRLLLQATQEISGVVAISNDLRRTDDAAILPADTISISSTGSLEAGGFGTLDVRINLSQVPAGEYHGAVILAHSAGSTRIPITVRTRDHWLMPLLILLAALAVGGGLSFYRELRKRPDELREQLAQLKLQVDSDSGLLAAFRDALTQRIEAAHQALERNKLADAETQIDEAEQCLRRWQQARSDWIKLGTRIESEQKNAELLPAQLAGEANTYRESVLTHIQELRQSLPKTETPQDANVVLKAISDSIAWQRQVDSDLTVADTSLNQISDQLSSNRYVLTEIIQALADQPADPDSQAAVTLQAQLAAIPPRISTLAQPESLRRRLARLNSADNDGQKLLRSDVDGLLSGINGIKGEVDSLEQQVQELNTRHNAPAPLPEASSFGGFAVGGEEPVAVDYGSLSEQIVKAGQRARWRLLIYQLVTIIVAAVLVIPLGMNQLYAANITFGANPLLDYPALLFWGIGLESSRESVVSLARTMMKGEKTT